LLVAREDPMIRTVEPDESRLRDVTGEMPAGADANLRSFAMRIGRDIGWSSIGMDCEKANGNRRPNSLDSP
jgi:hypothetical protein